MWRAVALLPLFAAACSDGTGPDDRGPAGLHVVAGGGAADTITAVLRQALVVELRDESGRPIVDAEVRFTSDGSSGAYVALAPLSGRFQFGVVERTDARGQAAALVQLGTRLGEANVSITVPALDLTTSASYTVRVGAAASVDAQPIDTMLYVGGAGLLRATVKDRAGNATTDAVQYEVPAEVSTVSVSASTVRGERIGRGYVVARSGALADTVSVSVVPTGTIAVYEPVNYGNGTGPPVPARIVVMQLDGSEMRVLRELPAVDISFGRGAQPRWSPSGAEIAFLVGPELWAVDMQRAARRLHTGAPTLSDLFTPEYAPSGEWIYVTQTTDSTGIWRVRADGTAIEKTAADWPQAASPSFASVGERMVYQTIESSLDFGPELRILDVATGERVLLRVPGHHPRWSPTGESIAYVDRSGRLRVMRPDGTGSRLVAGGIAASTTFTWSPNGQWLLVTRGYSDQPGWPSRPMLTLVNVASGELLPLYSTRTFVQPSWRR